MIFQTGGIVLNHTKYAETSVVVHIYTEQFGKQSYMVNGVRTARNKGKSILLQPLTLLEMQVYHNPKKEIQRIKEFKVTMPFTSIPFEQNKRSIAFFITEVMNKSFREEVSNPEMFQYLENAIIELDKSTEANSFHLSFLSVLTRYLGFYPDLFDQEDLPFFDLQNGHMTSEEPLHNQFLQDEVKDEWVNMYHSAKNSLTEYRCPSKYRDELIASLIDYYKLHLHDFSKLKTLDVLRSMHHN
jgi:DNA repair protein RecO (recombination protein O)